MKNMIWSLGLLSMVFLFTSCEEEEGAIPPEEGSAAAPFQELYDQGIDRYLGVFEPSLTEDLGGGVTKHIFQGLEGPICYTGNEFSMSTRDGSSTELMIFLQGGGFCAPGNCEAVEDVSNIPAFGILSPNDPTNPVASYNLGYIPYCDGTLFSGDSEADSDGDGENDRIFRGVQNLSASLDVIANIYPMPSKIFLTGNSAGGAGVHYALPLVRKLYPEVEIEVVNDSGVGVRVQSSDGQVSFADYWNSHAFFPASCNSCIAEDGTLNGYFSYQLSEDENMRMAFISSKQDEVISAGMVGGGPAYEEYLLGVTADLNEAYPERFNSLVADGAEHTFIIRQFNYSVAGTTVKQWITDMLSKSEDWVSKSD